MTKPGESGTPEKKKIFRGVPRMVGEVEGAPRGTPFQNLEEGLTGLPRLFILDRIEPTVSPNRKMVYHFSGKGVNFTRASHIVPADMEIQELHGKVGKKMIEDFVEFSEDDLGSYLKIMTMTIGTDPEIFVEDGGGKLLPAFTFLTSKEEAVAAPDGGFPVYWDGFQAEFETAAGTCLDFLTTSTRDGLKKVLTKAQVRNSSAKLSSKTVVELPMELIKATDDRYVEFGCTPSFNVYDLNGMALNGKEVPYRSTGGHIHFGINAGLKRGEKRPPEMIASIVKSLDAILAVCAVSAFANFDDPIRRNFYGLPGEYRLPPHGLEYRTLSNSWMFHPAIMNLFFDFGRRVVAFGAATEDLLATRWKTSQEETIETILSCDVERARAIMDTNKGVIMSLLKSAYRSKEMARVGFEVMYNGIETAVEEPTNIEKNWALNSNKWERGEVPHRQWRNAHKAIAEGKKI